ncbi:fumarylacetoacetase [Nostocaceae cyanobacterium CENA369]|uniref:fumarylacetoacetase n=1 Tax=Dendronalium phyllosphericum CENA369 TaxID=1725256 RepID=A0A8J7IFU5_9NOST|nr:fumarylacetoacetase [Dendronalium phyllosphericum]MBH8578178.1 fumarylacetoacetase [Dendronalium phyllosphericum CENA369]
MSRLNATHDPNLQSWVESANQPDTDFPIQNLPFGVMRSPNSNEPSRIGVAIGDQILDLSLCYKAGLLQQLPENLQIACAAPNLTQIMMMGSEATSLLRNHISQLLRRNEQPQEAQATLISMSDVDLLLPTTIGDYTDFYASIFHATNVGKLFRPDNPLLPNYKYVPIAYHGRASSIVPSNTAIARPQGQIKKPQASAPSFEFTQMLDYELEVGFFIGSGNELGQPIHLDKAEEHIFGLCLVNDWSARDIQAWEYQPLGPFLAKSFATTISPWVVTLEALAPFRCSALERAENDPAPLPYLSSSLNTEIGGIDIKVEVLLRSAQMRAVGMTPFRLSCGSFKQMYWTVAQMLAHHTSNGCNLRSGDLLASGTVSGPEKDSQGCLLEITQRGTQLVQLPTGEMRSFLCDGDEIILRGYCEKQGHVRIGFGECRGTILNAVKNSIFTP